MSQKALELDHVFVFVSPDAPEAAALTGRGLVPSYRRDHPGQGTRNLCFCFDNAYLELLWVSNPDAIRAPPIRRTGLAERAAWATLGTCPFGIAVRAPADVPLPFATWAYTPPYLPDGMAIDVAASSTDPHQPLLFRSPGTLPPRAWTDGRAGARQGAAGLMDIASVHLTVPEAVAPSPDVLALADLGLLEVEAGASHRLHLTLSGAAGASGIVLLLPDDLRP